MTKSATIILFSLLLLNDFDKPQIINSVRVMKTFDAFLKNNREEEQ